MTCAGSAVAPSSTAAVRKPGARPELRALTGVRFLAAAWVVLYHFALPVIAGGPKALYNIAATGYAAVGFFFVLSGFVLSYCYLNGAGEFRGSARQFWLARWARIYPAYLVAFLLAAPFNIAWTLRVNAALTGLIKLAGGGALVLLLQQAWTPWTAWYWNSPAWSLSAEAFFYFTFPFAAPRLGKLRLQQCLWALGLLWAVALCAPLALSVFKLSHGMPFVQDRLEMAVEFTPLLRWPEFLMGVLLGRIYELAGPLSPRASGRLTLGAAGILALVLCFSPVIPRPLLANGLLIPLFAALVFGLAGGSGWLAALLSRPFAVLLGEASYSVYILQLPVSYLLFVPAPHRSPAVFLGYFLVLTVVSILCQRYVEVPWRNWLKQRTAGPMQAKPAEPLPRVSTREVRVM